MTYRSLIRSVFDYGAVALDSMSKQNKEKFDSIQAQALNLALQYTNVTDRRTDGQHTSEKTTLTHSVVL